MNKDEIVAFVRGEIAKDSGITGAELTRRLREHWTQWTPAEFGAKSMRSFIEENVDGIGAVSTRGLDPVYGVVSASTPPTFEHELWRVWASPGSRYTLAISIGNGELHALASNAKPVPGSIKLASPTTEDHHQIARDFLDHQFQGTSSDLEQLIGSGPHWWQQWMKEVKKRGLSASWGQFRFHRLLSLFTEELKQQNVAEGFRDSAVIQLRASMKPEVSKSRPVELAGPGQSLSALRQLAMDAVGSMSEEDLRALKLPLGAVMDAIKRAG